jgi:hypothetical protein
MATPNLHFRIGTYLCWLSSVILPLGFLAIGGGPCAGPRNTAGSAILLIVGVATVIGPVYGIFRIVKFFRAVGVAAKIFGIISVVYASAVAVIGSLFLLFGAVSLVAFMHLRLIS